MKAPTDIGRSPIQMVVVRMKKEMTDLMRHGEPLSVPRVKAVIHVAYPPSPRWFVPPITTVPAEGPSAEMLRSVPTSSSARSRTWRLSGLSSLYLPDQIALASSFPGVMWAASTTNISFRPGQLCPAVGYTYTSLCHTRTAWFLNAERPI